MLAGPPMLQRAEEDAEFLEEREREEDILELWGIIGLGGALDWDRDWGKLSKDKGGTLGGRDGSSTVLLSDSFSEELDHFRPIEFDCNCDCDCDCKFFDLTGNLFSSDDVLNREDNRLGCALGEMELEAW